MGQAVISVLLDKAVEEPTVNMEQDLQVLV